MQNQNIVVSLHHTIKTNTMKTMIMTTEKLNQVLTSDLSLEPSQWEVIKSEMRTLENNNLRELVQLTNPVVKFLAKSILNERGAIKI